MKQCKKILNNGQRCSNQAVPGTDYCKQHKRKYSFKLINNKNDSNIKKKEIKSTDDTKIQNALPSAPNSKFVFPELTNDQRDILIAPSALVHIFYNKKNNINTNLNRFIISISNIIHLDKNIKVKINSENSNILIFISLEQKNHDNLSVFYDSVSDIANNCNATLYIGNDNKFIRYRDEDSPRGYDSNFTKFSENSLYLIDINKNYIIKQHNLKDRQLQDILMSIKAQKQSEIISTDTVFLKAPVALFPLISKYLLRRRLTFQKARCIIQNSDIDHFMIYEISYEKKSKIKPVPEFLLKALRDLPDCQVFIKPVHIHSKKILIEYPYEYPCPVDKIADVFSDNQIILFYGNKNNENFCISPEPVFVKGETFINAQAHQSEPKIAKPDHNKKYKNITIPLRIIHDSKSGNLVGALIINPEECNWLFKTLYLLPEKITQSLTFFWGQSNSIIQGQDLNIPLFPFGIQMQQVFDSNLFIPLHTRIVPSLTWNSIKNALNLSNENYTFLTPDFRLDCPVNQWNPLSKHIITNHSKPVFNINLKKSPVPELKWDMPEKIKYPETKKSFIKQIVKKSNQDVQKPPEDNKSPSNDLSEMADNFLNKGDKLSAGICFLMAHENIKAAQCIEKILHIDL